MMRAMPTRDRKMLGSGNRESLDIINMVLHVCVSWTMKTHIMYKCNLNSKQVQDYLDVILRFGLAESAESDSGRTLYKTTEKGTRFTHIYSELLEIFEIDSGASLMRA